MAATEDRRKFRPAEYLERLKEAIEYLQQIDPQDLSDEEYAELEQAIWKVWVWRGLRDQFENDLSVIERDVRAAIQDTYHHVNRTPTRSGRRRKHEFTSRNRRFQLHDEEG